MKQKLALVYVFFGLIANAQTNVKNKIAYQNGTLIYQQYAPNILKISFQQKGYTTNENFTDAVVLKPSAAISKALELKGDTVSIGTARLISSHQTNEYRGFSFLLK